MIPLTFESNGFFFKDYTLLGEYEHGMIIDWRNHPDIRNNMKTKAPVGFLDHFDFVEDLKKSNSKRYFHVTKIYPIGVIYLNNIQEDFGEIGLFIAPEILQKGFGSAMLRSFIDAVSLKKFTVEAREENKSAIKAYEKSGFTFEKKDGEFLKFQLIKT